MNTKMLKGKLGRMTLDGKDFIRLTKSGPKVIYTAPDRETAEKIAKLLDTVSLGGKKNGYRLGFKDGIGIGVSATAAVVFAIYAICRQIKKDAKTEESEENEEA